MAVRVFVAGGAGVIGRRLVPRLVARDSQGKATTRNPGKPDAEGVGRLCGPGSSETLVEVVRSRTPSLVGDGLDDVPVVMATVDRGGPGHPSWRQGFEGGLG
ncbi:hypothetical protein [Nonomuraea dietziae]|uniref:hypothetical protein n=1 Tax=Nonomuraea dietziae TaxID=65515 RepID=UPI0034397338